MRRVDSRPATLEISMRLTPEHDASLSALLDEALQGIGPPLESPCRRIVLAQGARLRPALTIATASLGGALGTDVMGMAAAVELLHCATLVHDDVIDRATSRRGVDTINAREGTATAIVAGDALIASAMGLAAQGPGGACSVLADTLARLCSGQSREEALRFDATARVEQTWAVAAGKTGSLLRAACLLGATAGGSAPRAVEALGHFGSTFGLCLQLVDDILDVSSTPGLLGKPVGADISAGVMTEPIVRGLRSHPELRGLLGAEVGSTSHDRALDLLRTGGAVEESIATADTLARTARAELVAIEDDQHQLAALAGWAPAYVRAQLRDKIDPGLTSRR